MKCPFIPGECLGRECPGWSLGRCFLEIFLQKMDNISLKLDTLCNLTSLTVTSQAAPGKPKHSEPFSPADLAIEKEISQAEGQDIQKELKEAGNQPTFWNVPIITREHERPDTAVRVETAEHPKEKESALANPPSEVLEGAHQSGGGDQAIIQAITPDKELLPVFPAKVSEIMFVDEAEARVNDPLGAAQSIEPQELTLELTAVEEYTRAEMADGLAVSERVLLMTQPANGAGTIDIVYDGIVPDLHADLPPAEPKEALTQPTSDSIVKDLVASHQEPALPAKEPPVETADAQSPVEALSVERVIDDITSVEEPAKTEAAHSGSVEEPEAPPFTAAVVMEKGAQPETIAAEEVPAHPPEAAAAPPLLEDAEAIAEEQGVVILEATPVIDVQAGEPATNPDEQARENLATEHAKEQPEAESPFAVDATGLDASPAERDIEVSERRFQSL